MAMGLIPTCNTPQIKYDVFLSFRGEDTRHNFSSHLHKALCDKQIETFIDYKLDRGDEISTSILEAIEESLISVVIFSKNFASSKWCLEELVKILQCREKNNRIVIPIFYEVDPSDIRHQTGSFAKAFDEHEQHFKESLHKVQRWKDALRMAANISGWHSSAIKPESVLIKNIVEDILKMLNNMSASDNNDLVGISSKIEQIVSLLCIGTEEVCSLGIWGIGGIGKTTLAEVIFNKISYQFEDSYFIQDVREQSAQSGGLNRLRQELLAAILGDNNMNIDKIEFLIGGINRLNSRSRIIITTRDKQVLRNCRVDKVYEVHELSQDEALELFSRYAFEGNHPVEDYMELSKRVVTYAGGVPLAFKVLGSSLLGKGKTIWESAIGKLETIPPMDIQKVLKISYDGLDDEVQKIFLDIGCFFKCCDIGLVKAFLDACGCHTEIGISILIDRSLINISGNRLVMHDLLQALAREIVRQESTEYPGKRSQLWHFKDIYHILTKNTGTETIEGISLDMSKIRDIHLNWNAFTNMHRLRFLKFYSSSYEDNKNKVHGFEALESDLAELRYLHWTSCPLKSPLSSFYLENLVMLHMRNSKVEQLWNGVQHLVKLKEVDLSFSCLTSCPDLSGFPNLERLILQGCKYLSEISSSIQYLKKLDFLDLTYCTSLMSVPDCRGLNSLKTLSLSWCSNLEMLPEMPCSIEKLYFRGHCYGSTSKHTST